MGLGVWGEVEMKMLTLSSPNSGLALGCQGMQVEGKAKLNQNKSLRDSRTPRKEPWRNGNCGNTVLSFVACLAPSFPPFLSSFLVHVSENFNIKEMVTSLSQLYLKISFLLQNLFLYNFVWSLPSALASSVLWRCALVFPQEEARLTTLLNVHLSPPTLPPNTMFTFLHSVKWKQFYLCICVFTFIFPSCVIIQPLWGQEFSLVPHYKYSSWGNKKPWRRVDNNYSRNQTR